MDREKLQDEFRNIDWVDTDKLVAFVRAECSETMAAIIEDISFDFSYHTMSVGLYEPNGSCDTLKEINLAELIEDSVVGSLINRTSGRIDGDDETHLAGLVVAELRRIADLVEAAIDTCPRP